MREDGVGEHGGSAADYARAELLTDFLFASECVHAMRDRPAQEGSQRRYHGRDVPLDHRSVVVGGEREECVRGGVHAMENRERRDHDGEGFGRLSPQATTTIMA